MLQCYSGHVPLYGDGKPPLSLALTFQLDPGAQRIILRMPDLGGWAGPAPPSESGRPAVASEELWWCTTLLIVSIMCSI